MAIEKTKEAAAAPAAEVIDQGYVAKLGGKVRKYKDALEATKTELEAAKKELNDLRSKPVDKTAAEYKAELRELKHRKIFDKIAAEHNALPEALDDLWKLSGYQPDTDDADEATLTALITEQAKSRQFLFKSDSSSPAADPAAALAAVKPPGPGGKRGGLVTASNTFKVTRDQLRNATWMKQNQAAYSAAISAGTVELTG
jgi:hypothetical protein